MNREWRDKRKELEKKIGRERSGIESGKTVP